MKCGKFLCRKCGTASSTNGIVCSNCIREKTSSKPAVPPPSKAPSLACSGSITPVRVPEQNQMNTVSTMTSPSYFALQSRFARLRGEDSLGVAHSPADSTPGASFKLDERLAALKDRQNQVSVATPSAHDLSIRFRELSEGLGATLPTQVPETEMTAAAPLQAMAQPDGRADGNIGVPVALDDDNDLIERPDSIPSLGDADRLLRAVNTDLCDYAGPDVSDVDSLMGTICNEKSIASVFDMNKADTRTTKEVEELLSMAELDAKLGEKMKAMGINSMAKRRCPGVIPTPPDVESPSDELPWCVLCNADALWRCLDCDGDLFCEQCVKETHRGDSHRKPLRYQGNSETARVDDEAKFI